MRRFSSQSHINLVVWVKLRHSTLYPRFTIRLILTFHLPGAGSPVISHAGNLPSLSLLLSLLRYRYTVHNYVLPFVMSDTLIFPFRLHDASIVKYDAHAHAISNTFSCFDSARLPPLTFVPVSPCTIEDIKFAMT